MQNCIRLRTALQVAERRAAQIARQQRAAEWRRRLSPAAYSCRRDGQSWIAEGPAGQRFDFSRTESGDILCLSHSGGIYLLTVVDGETVCDCPSAQKNGGQCKHTCGLSAVKMAHKMERIETRAALQAEGAELARLRAEGECAERAARAEAGSANAPVECWR